MRRVFDSAKEGRLSIGFRPPQGAGTLEEMFEWTVNAESSRGTASLTSSLIVSARIYGRQDFIDASAASCSTNEAGLRVRDSFTSEGVGHAGGHADGNW